MVIVAAVDRSARAVDVVGEATALADAFDDEVHVVYALSQGTFVELEQAEVRKSGRALDMDRIRAFATQVAEEAIADAHAEATAVGLVGDAADAVIDYASDHDARYVVVGPRRRSPTGKALFGSVSQSILLHADCPVLVTILDDE